MLIQECYKRSFVKTIGLVEWSNSFTRKASNDHCGFESQNLISLFLFVEEIDLFSHERFMYVTHVNAPFYCIQYHGRAD